MKTAKLLIAAALLLAAASAQAADWTLDLRSRATPASSARSAEADPGLVRRDVLPGEATPVPELVTGDTVTLLLFDGTRLDLRLEEAMPAPLSGGRVFTASLADGGGARTAVVIADRDGLTATVAGIPGGSVVRVFHSDEGTVVEERDPTAEPSLDGKALLPPPAAAQPVRAVAKADQSDQLVDVLVAYETGAQTWVARNGGMTNFAETAVQRMNAALANTGLDAVFRFRLVGVMAVDATETSVSSALSAVQGGSGVWAAVHERRDELGADVVSLLIDNGSAYGTTGQGYSLQATTASAAARFSESAYNACLVRSVAVSDTMTHETGHNLGCGHSNTQIDGGPGPQSFPYSSGYHFTGTDGVRYHTVMAYYTDGTYDDYTPIPFFSSPDFEYAGVPVGTAAANDNTRVLRQTAAWASAWRERKIPLSYDVFFAPAGGTIFTGSLAVELTPGRAGLPIRYTLDGTDPTLSSSLYSGPIVLTQTTTIRAAAVTDGILGRALEATYFLADLGNGLDAPQLDWTTDPDRPWTFVTDDTWDGTDAVQSGDDGSYSSSSWLSATVEGPAAMSFRYKMRTYNGTFSVLLDGTAQFADTRDIYADDWHLATVEIPDGAHTVKFLFSQKGRYSGFNGAWLDAVSFAAPSRPPVLSPATTTDLSTATTFQRTLSVTLAAPEGAAGTLYYTLDGSDPDPATALVYTGPIVLTATTRVRAVFVEDGKGPSTETAGLYIESHPAEPGEWTTDVDGVKAAAARDGSLIAVLLANRAGCWWSQQFYPVAESPAFLAWAKANGIYLVTADSSCNYDTGDAYAWFRQLYRSSGASGDIYYPSLCFALPAAPTNAIGTGLARNDSASTVGTELYLGTVDSLVAGFASVLDQTVPLPPSATPAGPIVDAFPLQVALSNPNAGGTLLYTLDGASPTPANGTRYTTPVAIPDASTVLRAAVWPASGLSSPVFVGAYQTVADVFGTTGIDWSTSGTASWRTEDGEPATLRAGGLMDGTTYQSTLSATVSGKGKLVFTYAFNSFSSRNSFAFAIDGKPQWQYAYGGSSTSFAGSATNEVDSDAPTTFSWTLSIAAAASDYGTGYTPQSGAWLSGVRWIPERDGVTVEGVFIPAAWFSTNFPAAATDAASREALARTDTDGDGFDNWKEALCGTDPNDSADCLRATLRMENGAPVVDWNLTAPMEGATRIIEGTPALVPSAWSTNLLPASFFRIRVLPPAVP